MAIQQYLSGIDFDFVLKVLLAVLLGMILGWEREKVGKAAGIRTYAFITLGAMVFTFVSINGFLSSEGVMKDPARIAAQIVTGIGFIGAGVIWKNKDHVEGVTTAAGLWVTASVGMLVGAGMIASSVLVTLVALVVFLSGKKFGTKESK